MKTENALAIGKEDQNGALIIDDTSRNAEAEQALDLMALGSTLEQAASKMQVAAPHLRLLISRNTEYDDKYARIKACRYIDMMERLVDFVDNLPDEVASSMEFKLNKQYDAYKFAIGKYDVHVAKLVQQMQANNNPVLNVTAEGGSRIVIQTAQPVNSPNNNQLGDSADGDAIEIES